jgi:hypothetical protein
MTQRSQTQPLFAAALVIGGAAAIVALETIFRGAVGGSLILTVAFWRAVAEGSVALASAAELTKARWVAPIKTRLLAVYPLILVTTLLLIPLGARIDLYPWADSQGLWLNQWFFLGRNVALSLVLFILASFLASDPEGHGPHRGSLIVSYLLVFVASQSLLAFDLVMSLEHPWISTLFGGYFFIEALFAGMALSGAICFFALRTGGPLALRSGDPEVRVRLRVTLKDTATLIFGFSLLWAGLFYAQFLVIWYGNIPEEASFLVRRLTESPVREISFSVLGAMFFAPFVLLISRRAKSSPPVVLTASLLVFYGVFAERVVFLAPVAPLNAGLAAAESVIMLLLAGVLISRPKVGGGAT